MTPKSKNGFLGEYMNIAISRLKMSVKEALKASPRVITAALGVDDREETVYADEISWL